MQRLPTFLLAAIAICCLLFGDAIGAVPAVEAGEEARGAVAREAVAARPGLRPADRHR